MAKKKEIVKESTVIRLKKMIKKYPSKDDLFNSEEFNNLTQYHLSAFEKVHLNEIIKLCEEDTPFDEIRLIVEQNKSSKKQKNEDMDPVEEAVSVFMVNDQKVIEVEPVKVTIGDEEDSEEQKSATNEVVNADTSDNKENKKSESQNSATNEVVNADTSDVKSSETPNIEKLGVDTDSKENPPIDIMTQNKDDDSAEPAKKPVEESKVQQKSAKEKTLAEIFADYNRACEDALQRIVVRGEVTPRCGKYKMPVAES